jgi:S-adenosylmethionine-diacylglycerol 3-amino-3-carboxypropyl transferase
MKERLTEKVSFDFIRYANCWEDADVLLKGLSPAPGSRILSVASAGDNCFSLLTTQPSLLVAADLNKTQLYLTDLKKAAIQYLSYDNLLEFLGFRECSEREQMFSELKGLISHEADKFWSANINQVKRGIIHAGKFEKYFRIFSSWILPLIHNASSTEGLLSSKSAEMQTKYYNNNWNTWKWRMLFRIFFSRTVMGKMGRDPAFFSEVKVPVSTYIFLKAEKHLQSCAAQTNHMLRYNLTGNFGNLVPHYLRPENVPVIKSNLEKLILKEGAVQDVAMQSERFHCMNLSDIFEYLSPEDYSAAALKLTERAEQGCRIAYWNLMVPRRISGTFPQKVSYAKELSQALTEADKGFFYNQFITDVVL